MYYNFMDTAIAVNCKNSLKDSSEIDFPRFVAETKLTYIEPASFPDTINVGIQVKKIGTSSVIYDVAMFSNKTDRLLTKGHFVHVYVDRESHRPTAIPDSHRFYLLEMLEEQE